MSHTDAAGSRGRAPKPKGRPIGVIQGAASDVIQGLLRDFVDRHRDDIDIVGLIEEPPHSQSSKGAVRAIRGQQRFTIFQELGSGSSSCGLAPEGVVMAGECVRRHIETGCDLVVLTKFAQLEADRGGLIQAFSAAIAAGVPVLTAVSPKFAAPWHRFANPLYDVLPPSSEDIDRWWREARGRADEPGPTLSAR
jgi:hypothetical protein